MPHGNRKHSNKHEKSGDIRRVPSLYSISGNMSPAKRTTRKSSGLRSSDNQNIPESIMMGNVDRWNSSAEISNRRASSPDRISEMDRDKPVAYVQPIVHKSPSVIDTSKRNVLNQAEKDTSHSMSDLAAYSKQPSSSTDRSAVVLEDFDNSLFILCAVSIFINPVMGPIATYCAWRAKKAFFAASWKSFRRWTSAAHAFSSLGFGLSAVAFGMIGIKLYHMYSGIQCYYKCSFLTNNEFNWQGFWDELNKNRAELTKNN